MLIESILKQQLDREGVLDCLEQLNRHYNLQVKFKTGYPRNGRNCPCAEPYNRVLIFPRITLLYNKYVLAHEYAHVTDLPVGTPALKWLNKHESYCHASVFERFYQEACQVMDIPYIPTERLQRALRAERQRRGIPKYRPARQRWEEED